MSSGLSSIGLMGLAVMGQNLALNVADKGYKISVFNRSLDKVDACVARAEKEGLANKLSGYKDLKEFVQSLEKPRRIIILVKAGSPVDATIKTLLPLLEEGDIIIDGGNEWYENTERREKEVQEAKGLRYMGMGVSGGEEGARRGPALMPGGTPEAYKFIQPIVEKVAAQTNDGPCVTYCGPGGAGNFVKMVHNGIEYGDMQLIAEAYDILKNVGGLNNMRLSEVFQEWNKSELDSFLIMITSIIFTVPDDKGDGQLVDKILDKTGSKGTGKWTVQQAAELSVPAPTIATALDGRYMASLKDERVQANKFYNSLGLKEAQPLPGIDQRELIDDGGCIIRAKFLDRIKNAYQKNPNLPNLLVDDDFAREIVERQEAWRRIVTKAMAAGVAVPGMTASLAYFDSYRRDKLTANLVQAQRDFFGSHTYERLDKPGGEAFHTVWDESFGSADSISSQAYQG